MNVTTIAGRIGKDAAVRQAGEYAVCNFDVAVESRVKGEKVTTWFRCALWGEPSGSPCRTQGPYYVVTPFHHARRRLAADAMIAEGKR